MVLCGFLAFAICFAAMAARSGVSAIAFATAAAAGVALGVEGVRLVPISSPAGNCASGVWGPVVVRG
jgi:hypothetical protein